MFGLFQFRFVTGNRRNRINQVSGIQTRTARLALISVCPLVSTMRTGSDNITIGQKLPCLLIVELHGGLLDKFTLIIQFFKKSRRKFVMGFGTRP